MGSSSERHRELPCAFLSSNYIPSGCYLWIHQNSWSCAKQTGHLFMGRAWVSWSRTAWGHSWSSHRRCAPPASVPHCPCPCPLLARTQLIAGLACPFPPPSKSCSSTPPPPWILPLTSIWKQPLCSLSSHSLSLYLPVACESYNFLCILVIWVHVWFSLLHGSFKENTYTKTFL